MSSPSKAADIVVENRAQLLQYLTQSGCPREQWRIGTEHEKFGFDRQTLAPLPYEGDRGIEAVLAGFVEFGWNPIEEAGKLIALSKDGCSVTLEPAGQLELSGAPLEHLHQTCAETGTHLREVRKIADRIAMLHGGRIIWDGPVADIDRSDNAYVDQFIHGRAEGPIQMDVRRP